MAASLSSSSRLLGKLRLIPRALPASQPGPRSRELGSRELAWHPSGDSMTLYCKSPEVRVDAMDTALSGVIVRSFVRSLSKPYLCPIARLN